MPFTKRTEDDLRLNPRQTYTTFGFGINQENYIRYLRYRKKMKHGTIGRVLNIALDSFFRSIELDEAKRKLKEDGYDPEAISISNTDAEADDHETT